MDWTEKYRPGHLQDLIGNNQILQQMVLWARSWTVGSKPLLLYGKPGTGKTSSAHALAHDMGWDIVEMNASDQRTKDAVERIAGSSAITASLTGSPRKLILLDEVDNLHGTADRGGAKALLDIIKIAAQPMLLVANTLQDVPADLRSRCEPLQFRSIQARSIVPRLKFICSEERTTCTDTALRQIAERSGGDVRAAITMLYAAAIGRDHLGEIDIYSTRKDDRSTIF
jgi:replication factor C large subunit